MVFGILVAQAGSPIEFNGPMEFNRTVGLKIFRCPGNVFCEIFNLPSGRPIEFNRPVELNRGGMYSKLLVQGMPNPGALCAVPHPFPSEIGAIGPLLSVANSDDKQGRFDSTKFSEGGRFRIVGAVEPLRFPSMRTAKVKQKGGSIAPNFPKGLLHKLKLSNRCGVHCKYGQQAGAVR